NALRLETSTPADGANQFVNSLNPRIELYNPSAILVASGTALADGRNEFIQYTPLTIGMYRIRVTGESNTTGEYLLTKNFRPEIGSLSVAAINEGETGTLSGTISDPDASDTHLVTITWGPGQGSSTVNLAAGIASFTATHPYADDNPSGTAADDYPISVTVTDNHESSVLSNTTVTVSNVAPTI